MGCQFMKLSLKRIMASLFDKNNVGNREVKTMGKEFREKAQIVTFEVGDEVECGSFNPPAVGTVIREVIVDPVSLDKNTKRYLVNFVGNGILTGSSVQRTFYGSDMKLTEEGRKARAARIKAKREKEEEKTVTEKKYFNFGDPVFIKSIDSKERGHEGIVIGYTESLKDGLKYKISINGEAGYSWVGLYPAEIVRARETEEPVRLSTTEMRESTTIQYKPSDKEFKDRVMKLSQDKEKLRANKAIDLKVLRAIIRNATANKDDASIGISQLIQALIAAQYTWVPAYISSLVVELIADGWAEFNDVDRLVLLDVNSKSETKEEPEREQEVPKQEEKHEKEEVDPFAIFTEFAEAVNAGGLIKVFDILTNKKK